MKLKKRKSNGIWMLTHEGRRISTGERRHDKAERVARIIIENDGKKPTVKGSRRTLGEALQDVYERIWSRQKAEKETRYRMLSIARDVGHVDVTEISYAWLVAYAERLHADGKAPSTVNRKLSSIRVALKESHKLGFIDVMPAFPFQKEKQNKLRWLTDEEQLHLVGCASVLWPLPDARFVQAMVHTLVYTGARFSEFHKACVERTFTAERMQFIETKNGDSRSIPLRPEILPYVQLCSDYLREHRADLGYQGIHLRFKKLVEYAGLKDVTLHTLRHTCASRLVSGGADLYRVMHWLGHKDIHTTQRYAHLAPSALDTDTVHVLPPVEATAHRLHSVQKGA